MNRKEIKTATDGDVIVDYILSYAWHAQNTICNRGTERLAKHLADLDAEMLKRGILNQEQIDRLNM